MAEIGEKTPVTISEAYDILDKRKKEGELTYIAKQTYEYLGKFKKLSTEKAQKMKKELMDLGLSAATATKIVDILPVNIDQLKQVLIMEKRPIDESQVNAIMEVVEKYRKEK